MGENETFDVTVSLTLAGVTNAQLAAFIAAGLAAVPPGTLSMADLNIKMTPAAPPGG